MIPEAVHQLVITKMTRNEIETYLSSFCQMTKKLVLLHWLLLLDPSLLS